MAICGRSIAWECCTNSARRASRRTRHRCEWYRKAAEKGFAPGTVFPWALLRPWQGGAARIRQALAWYGSAAQQGNSDAMLNLAYLYHNGLGVPKDEARSFDYVRQAAEAGSRMPNSS